MNIRSYFSIAFPVLFFLLPLSASAATTFEVSGWLPYWRAASSTADAIAHISELTEIDPFVYSVSTTGKIVDNGPMDQAPWTTLLAAAKVAKVRVIPTVMWSNSTAENAILSNTTKRIALENAITKLVKTNGYDGIDIDFEAKPAEDRNYFSTFLKGLYSRMGNKWVMCDIEARTPIEARYPMGAAPADATDYANDFTQINKYCDRVRLMTYDQQTVDQQLANLAASSSELYAPVADPAWVEAVVNLAEESISPKKLVVGVPTYGYEYDVTAYAGSEYNYDIMWTFDPGYATQIEQEYGVAATRNGAGEMELTYIPKTATSSLPLSTNLQGALIAATAATAYADSYNSHMDFRLLDWPGAQSISDKVSLAQAMGVRGIAIFKLDGGEDPNVWSALAGVKK